MKEAITLLLIEDHQMVREGLTYALQKRLPRSKMFQAGTGARALEIIGEVKPDLVLMDIMLADTNGMDLSARILEFEPNTRIIALSLLRDKSVIRALLGNGVAGYIPKEADVDELVRGMEQVLSGEVFLGSGVPSILFKDDFLPEMVPGSIYYHLEPDPETLTRREVEVLKLIVDEYTTEEIGHLLCISDRTVQSHRKNLKEKIGCRNVAGLVKYAIKHGLISKQEA
ncbi:MAG: response regulator transcription factor [Bacteroidota bacterium]